MFGTSDEATAEAGVGGGRLLALEMAALRTCVKLGLMPHARHGGSGVWAFAEVGSKFDGTGLEKLQMVHTHVPEVTAGGFAAGREDEGDDVASFLETAAEPLRCWGLPASEVPRGRSDERF